MSNRVAYLLFALTGNFLLTSFEGNADARLSKNTVASFEIIESAQISPLSSDNEFSRCVKKEVDAIDKLLSFQTARNGNQGCCSHHQGVCGCGGFMLQCCDGTLSPSCGC